MNKNIQFDAEVLDEILSELWINSHFDEHCNEVLEQVLKLQERSREDKPTTVSLDVLEALSTVRNKNILTSAQQKKLRNTTVAFFGLSVGSHAALTWVMQARPVDVKLSDPDKISASNLNRLRFGWDTVGKLKVEVVKDLMINMNPEINVLTLTSTKINDVLKCLSRRPKVDAIVDEIDSLDGKIILRKFAKSHNIPLLSATDVGDNILLDIERYDLIPQPEPFLGKLNIDMDNIDVSELSPSDKRRLIIKLVGFEYNSKAMLGSLRVIGKKTLTWPQLGATATIAGGVIATALKKIIIGEKVLSGRYHLSLDDIMVSDFNSQARKKKRKKLIEELKKSLLNVRKEKVKTFKE